MSCSQRFPSYVVLLFAYDAVVSWSGTGERRKSLRKGPRRPRRATAVPGGLEALVGECYILLVKYLIHNRCITFFLCSKSFYMAAVHRLSASTGNEDILFQTRIRCFFFVKLIYLTIFPYRRHRRSRSASRSPRRKLSRSPSPRR